MHSEKNMEDTWKPAELKKHLRDRHYVDGHSRHREDNERKHDAGGSVERRHRDPEESRRDRDKLKESERRHRDGRDRHGERRKDGSHDRRGGKDGERRDDRDRKRQVDDGRSTKEKVPDKEDSRERERNKDRHKPREKEGLKEREEDRDKRREQRDKERREEKEGEHRRERRKHDETGDARRDQTEKPRDRRHRGEYEDNRRDKDVQEDRRRSERTEDREYKKEHRHHKEEVDRRHKERKHDEKRSHQRESKEHQALKKYDVNERGSRDDRDRTDRDKEIDKRHREISKKEEEEGADRRRRDRRHGEEEKELAETNHREKHGSKKSSSDQKQEETKVKQSNLAEQEYEDDFEDYEEDFEDVDESADEHEEEDGREVQTTQQNKEMEAIRRAMAEENQRAGTAQSRRSMSREKEEEDRYSWSKGSDRNESQTSRRGKFINFVAAKQREVSKKVATKQNKRSAELLRLIDLDFSLTFSILDIPPVSEYEMYIKSFGNANTKQAYSQCNEDNADREIQTEEVDTCEKWTQHPPEYVGACGDPNFSQDARDKTRSELVLDSQRLMSFLRSASQVMVVLLEEDQAERSSLRKLKTQTDSLSFSDGSLRLNTKLPFLLGRQISLVQFSEVQKHVMLSVHMPTTKASYVRLDSCTVICVWNIWEPSRPQKILIYESMIQCCCFSPGKSPLVFAGTQIGSVVLWDLREYASNHYRLKIGDYEWTFRHPTFSTDAMVSSPSHVSPVTSIEVVPSFVAGGLQAGIPLLSSEEESSGLSFQVASLDENGFLNFWVVVDLPKGNEAGSPTDLGLRPGGKVKLLHSSSVLTVQRPSPKDAAKTWPFQALLLKYHPTDSNHFFIGTNLGLVRHGTSHGLKAPPQFYRFQDVEERTVDITSIHFSPFKSNLFLVGCADGSIRLHTVSHDQSVAEWMNSTAGEPVISLQWTQTRPAVFCVLDGASNLHVWDMLKDDAQPVVTEKLTSDRVTAMALFGDSGQQNTYSGVALAHESGNIELKYFIQTLTMQNPAEEEKLELMIESF